MDNTGASTEQLEIPAETEIRQRRGTAGYDLEANLEGDFYAVPVRRPKTHMHEYPKNDSSPDADVIYLKLRRAVPYDAKARASVMGTKVLLFLVITSWFVLIGLVTLQMIGFQAAIAGLQDTASGPPHKVWCSPGFQLAANPDNIAGSLSSIQPMIFDGTCELNYTVTINEQGTGCIALKGDQPLWLKGTAYAISFQLLLQIIDVYLLLHYRNFDTRWVHLRPVCTMVTGVIVWGFLTIAAGVQTKDYPLVSGVVAVIAPAQPACRIQMDSAGLRGEIIAWSDGVLSAFGSVYFGPFGFDSGHN